MGAIGCLVILGVIIYVIHIQAEHLGDANPPCEHYDKQLCKSCCFPCKLRDKKEKRR